MFAAPSWAPEGYPYSIHPDIVNYFVLKGNVMFYSWRVGAGRKALGDGLIYFWTRDLKEVGYGSSISRSAAEISRKWYPAALASQEFRVLRLSGPLSQPAREAVKTLPVDKS
jgi:hypothetical protein